MKEYREDTRELVHARLKMQTEKVIFGLKKHARDKYVCQKKHGCYHSSVSQAQGSSYFITNDGNVPTSPYRIPAKTQTLS
jgi:hypothetical protein